MELGAIATAIGTIATGAFAFVKWYLPWRREKKQNVKTISGMQSIHNLYGAMQEMVDPAIDRIILFAGHNGGGIPSASKPFYVTALHWIADAASGKVIEDYAGIRVDAEYVSMLLSIREKGHVFYVTDEMPDCKLRQYYHLEGVSQSIIVFLTVKNKRFYYLSAASHQTAGLTLKQVSRVLLKAEKIRNLLEGEREAG